MFYPRSYIQGPFTLEEWLIHVEDTEDSLKTFARTHPKYIVDINTLVTEETGYYFIRIDVSESKDYRESK